MLLTERSVPETTKNYIECLPTELLLMILEEFHPTYHGKGEYRAVQALASVCQSWREVILDDPGFWTHIILHATRNELEICSDNTGTVTSGYPARLVLHLKRTKSAPLDIFWSLTNEAHPQLMDIIHSMAPLSRWRTLILNLPRTGQTLLQGTSHGINVSTGGEPEMPRVIGTFENLKELSVQGFSKCPAYWVDLVESTALKLEKLDLGMANEKLVQTGLSNASQRVSKPTLPEDWL